MSIVRSLLGYVNGPRIGVRAPQPFTSRVNAKQEVNRRRLTALIVCFFITGCARQERKSESDAAFVVQPCVIVVAPVVNLSGRHDFDPLVLTDLVASEFLSFPNIMVVPVNQALAALALNGKAQVETAEDAIELARAFSADMTVVIGVTEYNPYDPPVTGMILQAYVPPELAPGPLFDPVAASRRASPIEPASQTAADSRLAPVVQVQRVFNASHDWVVEEVQRFARDRDGGDSPLGWRRVVRSQELYLRYCAWSIIRSMLRQESTASDVPTQVRETP